MTFVKQKTSNWKQNMQTKTEYP